ncbi:hypothetical protein OB13_10810 [Pontibacter sp. HJ8]|jgi:hypothetical protein
MKTQPGLFPLQLTPLQAKALAELIALGVDKPFALESIADEMPLLQDYDNAIEEIYLDYRAGLTI